MNEETLKTIISHRLFRFKLEKKKKFWKLRVPPTNKSELQTLHYYLTNKLPKGEKIKVRDDLRWYQGWV